MAELKPGDRVHVEFDGVIREDHGDFVSVMYEETSEFGSLYVMNASHEHVTKFDAFAGVLASETARANAAEAKLARISEIVTKPFDFSKVLNTPAGRALWKASLLFEVEYILNEGAKA